MKPKKTKKVNEKKPLNNVRYDGKSHWPSYDENSYASRCKHDDCNSKTNVICTKCKVHLCFIRGRNCFKEFHILDLDETDLKNVP